MNELYYANQQFFGRMKCAFDNVYNLESFEGFVYSLMLSQYYKTADGRQIKDEDLDATRLVGDPPEKV